MPRLSQAAVSRVGHQDMAHHPCGRVQSVPRLVDPEEVDVPVEIRLEVPRRHPLEAPQVAFQPGAQVVHHLHPLQVDRVVHIGPVFPALEPIVPDQCVLRPLQVVDQQRSGRYPAAHGLPHARRSRLPVAADDRDRVLVGVDGDADAQLLTGQAALAGLPVALGEVGVVDVGLVHPDGVAQHDPVLVAGYRGEQAVPPLEGGHVGDAAQLGRALDGHVVAHEPDEGDPGGEGLAVALEDGAGGEVILLPQQRQRHLGTPAAGDPYLQAPRPGHPGRGRQAAAASASVPTPTSSRQRLSSTASLSRRNSSAVRPATSFPKGFALPI